MELKSFGCSLIFGTDLPDVKHPSGHSTASNLTWPALTAQRLGMKYSCHARAGIGNLQILNKILNHVARNEQAFYVIGWTYIDRLDYTTVDGIWQTLMPGDNTQQAKSYYRDLHSQYRDKLSALIVIKSAIDALTQKGYPFFMTYHDDLIVEDRYHTASAVSYLQEYVRPHLRTFEGKTFLEWARDREFEISETNHPLESAHQIASVLQQPFIDAILHKA